MLIRACDICKSYPADTYVMHTAKRPDLSGHGYETIRTTIDLCKNCVAEIFKTLLFNFNNKELREFILNEIDKKKKRKRALE